MENEWSTQSIHGVYRVYMEFTWSMHGVYRVYMKVAYQRYILTTLLFDHTNKSYNYFVSQN